MAEKLKLSNRGLVWATGIGTVLQLLMVLAGHASPDIARFFPEGGMAISLAAGVLYTVIGVEAITMENVAGGAIAGGACALLGTVVSRALGDVPLSVLMIGTVSGVITGAAGGWIGRLFSSGRV